MVMELGEPSYVNGFSLTFTDLDSGDAVEEGTEVYISAMFQ